MRSSTPALFGVHRSTGRIDLSGSPAPGVGGLTVVGLAVLVTLVSPGVWVILAGTVVGGLALAAATAWGRATRGLAVPDEPSTRLLYGRR